MFIPSTGLPAQKGTRTRARILEAALTLFEKKGYAGTTLRDIAAEADVSLGLTYRYFRSKEDLVVVVYEGVAERVSKHVARLPHATIGERFQALFEHKLRLLAPHRDAFGALLSAAVDPSSKAAVLGDSSSRVRQAMELAFVEVVAHATDAPSPDVTQAVALVLYAAHFALLLVWVHDETRGARRTRELLGTLRDTIVFVRPLLGAPGATMAMTRIAGALAPIFWKETST